MSRPPRLPRRSRGGPCAAGIACCVAAALGYTTMNICLRDVALECDPAWVTCMRALVPALCLVPWFATRHLMRTARAPSSRAVAPLLGAALIGQFVGNLGFQYSIQTCGLILTVPIVFASMLGASALLGRVFLGECIARRTACAIGLLVASIVLFSLSAPDGVEPTQPSDPHQRLWGWVGVLAATLAGLAYASLTVVIRHVVAGRMKPTEVVLVVTGVGAVSLGVLSLWRVGLIGMLLTPTESLLAMTAAGGLNLFSFLLLAKGFQLTTVAHANLLNASQVALSAVAGVIIFAEPAGPLLLVGIVLTCVALMVAGKQQTKLVPTQD